MHSEQSSTESTEVSTSLNQTKASTQNTTKNASEAKKKPAKEKGDDTMERRGQLRRIAQVMAGKPGGDMPACEHTFGLLESDNGGVRHVIRYRPDNTLEITSEDVFRAALAQYFVFDVGSSIAAYRFYKTVYVKHVLEYFYMETTPIHMSSVKFIGLASDKTLALKRLPFDLDSTAATPAWDSLMSQMDFNQRPFMWWIGSLFDDSSDKSQYLYLYGAGGSGKSRVVSFLQSVLERASIVTLPPRQNDRFWFSSVYDKRVVIMSDVENYRVVQSPEVKIITGDSVACIERKGEQPFQASLRAKLLMCSNHAPGISSGSADTRRIIHINMRQVAADARLSPEIFDKMLLDEAHAFLSRCYRIYTETNQPSHLNADGSRATHRGSGPCPVDSDALEEIASSNEGDFLEAYREYITDDPDLCLTRAELSAMGTQLGWQRGMVASFRNWLRDKKQLKYTNRHLKGDKNKNILSGLYGCGVRPEFRRMFASRTPLQPFWSQRSEVQWADFMKELGHKAYKPSVVSSEISNGEAKVYTIHGHNDF
jgi:hypothetical protein